MCNFLLCHCFSPIGCHTVPHQSSRVEQLESHCKPVGHLSTTSWWQTWTFGLTSCWGSSECTLKFPFDWLAGEAEVQTAPEDIWRTNLQVFGEIQIQDAAAVCNLVSTDIMLHRRAVWTPHRLHWNCISRLRLSKYPETIFKTACVHS